MPGQLIISVSPWDVRAALVEDGRLAEMHVERLGRLDPTGNVYLGRVQKVIPGMAAAFVDIGLDQPGYLFIDDAAPPLAGQDEAWSQEDTEELWSRPSGPAIQDLVTEGQELLVQVWRPPLKNKAARLTTQISLPGRYLVYLPTRDHMAISRRLAPDAERQRLFILLQDLKPREGGLIARTASAGQTPETLAREQEALAALWRQICRTKTQAAAPALLHQEQPVLRRLVRDLLTPEVTRVVVDDPQAALAVREYLQLEQVSHAPAVDLYQGRESLFAGFSVEEDWRRLLAPKIWLKSGGYLVISPTEALTAIDVNTGRHIRGKDLADTILSTNLEAAREIARQVRLRDLGGIIVIDFIDMEQPAHQEQVWQTLQQALQPDRARTTVHPVSPLGLVEMTRQRLGDSLVQVITEPCPCCRGQGVVLSPLTVAHDLLRQLALEVREFPDCRLTVQARPEIITLARSDGADFLRGLERRGPGVLQFAETLNLPRGHFEIIRELQNEREKV